MHVVRARAGTYELEHLEIVEGVPVVDLRLVKSGKKIVAGRKEVSEGIRSNDTRKYRIVSYRSMSHHITYELPYHIASYHVRQV